MNPTPFFTEGHPQSFTRMKLLSESYGYQLLLGVAGPVFNYYTTFSNGCLGSHSDEERSEMRYVMRIARPRESSKLRTHIALSGFAW